MTMPREGSRFELLRAFDGVRGFAECCRACGAVRVWAIGEVPAALGDVALPPWSLEWSDYTEWVQRARAEGTATPWAPSDRELCDECRTDEIRQQDAGFQAAIGRAVAPTLGRSGRRAVYSRECHWSGSLGHVEVSSAANDEYRVVQANATDAEARAYEWRSGIGFGLKVLKEYRGEGFEEFDRDFDARARA